MIARFRCNLLDKGAKYQIARKAARTDNKIRNGLRLVSITGQFACRQKRQATERHIEALNNLMITHVLK